eukprot:SAG31_NODE_4304_length_3370_cov_1.370835_3_plen_88_part_00
MAAQLPRLLVVLAAVACLAAPVLGLPTVTDIETLSNVADDGGAAEISAEKKARISELEVAKQRCEYFCGRAAPTNSWQHLRSFRVFC